MEKKELKNIYSAKVLLLGKNIDTDQIFPARFLEVTEPKEIAKLCLYGVDPAITSSFPKGGIIVGGSNFGCGSSRESAAIALIEMGASLVVAESFARIFFRNAINLGLPLITCAGISEKVKDGDEIKVDLEGGIITNLNNNENFPFPPLGEHALAILKAGGIKELMRQRLP